MLRLIRELQYFRNEFLSEQKLPPISEGLLTYSGLAKIAMIDVLMSLFYAPSQVGTKLRFSFHRSVGHFRAAAVYCGHYQNPSLFPVQAQSPWFGG